MKYNEILFLGIFLLSFPHLCISQSDSVWSLPQAPNSCTDFGTEYTVVYMADGWHLFVIKPSLSRVFEFNLDLSHIEARMMLVSLDLSYQKKSDLYAIKEVRLMIPGLKDEEKLSKYKEQIEKEFSHLSIKLVRHSSRQKSPQRTILSFRFVKRKKGY